MILFWYSNTLFYGPVIYLIVLYQQVTNLYIFFFFSVVLAEVVPYLGLFISLVGAISSTALALIFPPLLELTVIHGISEMHPFTVTKDVIIILIGVVATITGTYASLVEIVTTFQAENL